MSILKKNWTKAGIVNLVVGNELAAMRGICALFKQQTEGEKVVEGTVTRNFRGFSVATAKQGSEMAKWMTDGKMDGVFRRPVTGVISEWKRNPASLKAEAEGRSFRGRKWLKNDSAFVGRDRVSLCAEFCEIHAGQLADIANGRL